MACFIKKINYGFEAKIPLKIGFFKMKGIGNNLVSILVINY